MKRILLPFLLMILCVGMTWAQKKTEPVDLSYFLPVEKFAYNPDIPKPKDVLGFEVGQQHVTYDQVLNYMAKLAETSDRVIIDYSKERTYEYRPMVFLTITSPENHKNLDAILEQHRLLSDPEKSASLNLDDMPIVVSLQYSVHGNEASGINGSLPVAYFLAAAQGPEIDTILKNAVILFQPAVNPDGSQRFASWVNATRSFTEVSDPSSREFSEAWPGGRTNHYWFDLNRDWLPLQHPESRARNEMYFKMRPNVVNDHHEQGTSANFFFMPGVQSRTNPITDDNNWEMTRKVAEFHAKELDKIKPLYYSREGFDDYYYGKGSTFPDIHGAVAMLFEQGSSRGHAQMSPNGVLTIAFASRNQSYTGYSSIRAAIAMRKELLEYQRQAYIDAYNEAKRAPVQAYVFGNNESKTLNVKFLNLLERQRIDAYKLAKNVTVDGQEFTPENSYIVPVTQQEYRAIRTIFEKITEFRDSVFYDISAWTMPIAYNLPYGELKTSSGYVGDKVENAQLQPGVIDGGKAGYAYLFGTNEYFSHKVIYELLNNNVRLRVSQKPFRYIKDDGTVLNFNYGTILVPVGHQDISEDELYTLISGLAKEWSVDMTAVNHGAAPDVDLGSPAFAPLRLPKVALIVGQGANTGSAGEVWHLFDDRFKIPMSLLDQANLDRVDFNKYNTIIITGNHTGISKTALENLKIWANNGGVIVTLGQGWNITNKLGLTDIKKSVTPETGEYEYKDYVTLANIRDGKTIAGVILNCHLDRSHPIGYGYNQDSIRVFRSTTDFFVRPTNEYITPLYYTKNPVVGGFVSYENSKKLENTPAVMAGKAGKGTVIMFADNPNFRAFWYGTNKMFLNAIFYGDIIKGDKIVSETPKVPEKK